MKDCCSTGPDALRLDEALAEAARRVVPIADAVAVPLHQCFGRILAEDLRARIHVPGHDNSAMDGYAVRAADCSAGTALKIVGQALAGHPFPGVLHDGEAVRITTGAPMPQGADTVVMVEDTIETDGIVDIQSVPDHGQHVRPRGGDMHPDQPLLSAGLRLRPQDVALAASQGFPSLPVLRRVRVGVFSSGDEVVEPGRELPFACLYDTNRFALIGMLQAQDIYASDLGILPDDPAVLREAISSAASSHDALVTTGGVSVGVADHLKAVIEEFGRLDLWRLAIKPGKPIAFGSIGRCLIFGLPGNPVSAIVTFLMFARPLLLRLQGRRQIDMQTQTAELAEAVSTKYGRREFLRGTLRSGMDGRLVVQPHRRQGSNLLADLVAADCLIDVDEDDRDLAAGAAVRIIPISAGT